MQNLSASLRVGDQYTRAQLQDVLKIPESDRRGNWTTGYHCHCGEWYVFVNVGTAGRTGHDYANQWKSAGLLHWRGKTNSAKGQPAIESLLAGPTHVFTRQHDRDPFQYQGVARVVSTEETVPVTVCWRFG